MEKEITLEEIFQSIREELSKPPRNHPLAFTSKQFKQEMGCGRRQAWDILKRYEKEGRVKQTEVWIVDSMGRNQPVKGWQWIKN